MFLQKRNYQVGAIDFRKESEESLEVGFKTVSYICTADIFRRKEVYPQSLKFCLDGIGWLTICGNDNITINCGNAMQLPDDAQSKGISIHLDMVKRPSEVEGGRHFGRSLVSFFLQGVAAFSEEIGIGEAKIILCGFTADNIAAKKMYDYFDGKAVRGMRVNMVKSNIDGTYYLLSRRE